MENFYHEWEVNDLPWDAVTPVAPGDGHPEELDQRLVHALYQRALNEFTEEQKAVRGGSLAFLYLYMILAGNQNRWVFESSAGRYSSFTLNWPHQWQPYVQFHYSCDDAD